jgi:hypothetical protein
MSLDKVQENGSLEEVVSVHLFIPEELAHEILDSTCNYYHTWSSTYKFSEKKFIIQRYK